MMGKIDLILRFIRQKFQKNPAPPKNLFLDIVKGCNFKCQYCFSRIYSDRIHQSNCFQHMSSDMVRYLLKEAWVLGCRTVTFGGLGEPTMHPDFYLFLSWAKEIGYSIEFTSNGWMLAPEKLSMLDRRDVVRISIDTMHLQGSPLPGDYLNKMKILFTKIQLNFKMIAVTHGDFTSDIQMMFLENNISTRYYPLAKKARSASPEKKRTSFIPCLYPWYSITVHIDFTLGPCPCLNWFSIGELNEKIKLADFWNGDEMNSFRSQLLTGDLPEICKICDRASRDTSDWIKVLLQVS